MAAEPGSEAFAFMRNWPSTLYMAMASTESNKRQTTQYLDVLRYITYI